MGGNLEIRGDLNDETVLISSSKSYKIQQNDSSNTILITSLNNKHIVYDEKNKENLDKNMDVDMLESEAEPNLLSMDHNESIHAAISCIYVLTQQPPKLNKLHQILYQRPYKGVPSREVSLENDEDDEQKEEKADLTLDGLKNLVQCSDMELLQALEEINAIKIDQEYRIIDEEYFISCFQDILYCIMENDIDYKKFQSIDILQNMEDYPAEIITHCIKIHSLSRKEDENGYWAFDENKVSVFIAKRILKENGNKMKDSEFMEEWNNNLIYGMPTNKEILYGHLIAIYQKTAKENVWFIFEETALSLDPKTRFKQLFERKDEWKKEEIKHYLASLTKSGQSVDKLLLRHSRMVRTKDNNGNEKRIYISRNSKRNR